MEAIDLWSRTLVSPFADSIVHEQSELTSMSKAN